MDEIEDPWHSRPIDVHRWSDHPEVSVHDSYIIDCTRVAEMRAAMAKASEAVVGRP